MSQRSAKTFSHSGCLAIVVLLCAPAWGLTAGQATGNEGAANPIDAQSRHAETYYLLGVTEQGDVPACRAGLRELEQAEKALQHATLPPEEVDRLGRHIKSLRRDLQDRIEMARWTLEGVFPLTGFLTSSSFADSGPAAIYRLIDDPAVEAVGKAAANLVAHAGPNWRRNKLHCPWYSPTFLRKKPCPARRSPRRTATRTVWRPGLWSKRCAKRPRIAAVSGANERRGRTMRWPPPEQGRRRPATISGPAASPARSRRSCSRRSGRGCWWW